jgi:hypothetical protein
VKGSCRYPVGSRSVESTRKEAGQEDWPRLISGLLPLWLTAPCTLGWPAVTRIWGSFSPDGGKGNLLCLCCCWTASGKLEVGQQIVAHVWDPAGAQKRRFTHSLLSIESVNQRKASQEALTLASKTCACCCFLSPESLERRGKPLSFKRLGRLQQIMVATWLILPVVICLSQRLSHACLSVNNSYETANGSLNQLSFI